MKKDPMAPVTPTGTNVISSHPPETLHDLQPMASSKGPSLGRSPGKEGMYQMKAKLEKPPNLKSMGKKKV